MKTIINMLYANMFVYQNLITVIICGSILIWVLRSGFIFGPQTLRLGIDRRRRFPGKHGVHPNTRECGSVHEKLTHSSGFCHVGEKQIWYQCFTPSAPVALVVMYHGYGDHSDFIMYENAHDLSLRLNAVVVSFDQPGFGRSDGVWGLIPNWFSHVEDCVSVSRLIVAELDLSLPLFGYGHSMGGGVAITASIMYPEFYKGIILIAPMCGLAPNLRQNYLIELFFFVLARIFPALPITPLPDLGSLCYQDPSYHAHSSKHNFLGYPGKVRLGTAKSMLIAQSWIKENASRITTPFLLLHGDNDFVTSLDSSKALHARAGTVDKEMNVLEGYFHTIIGPGQPRARSDAAMSRIVDWITNRLEI